MSVAEQRPAPRRRAVQQFRHDGGAEDVLKRRGRESMSTKYAQRIHLAGARRQEAADVIRRRKSVIKLNAEDRYCR